MLKQTKILKAKLEKSRRSGYQNPISPLRPGQESIMVVRPWKGLDEPFKGSQNAGGVKR